jgi:hypothetical protein
MQRVACRPPERLSAVQGGAAVAPKGLIFVRFHGRMRPPVEISGPGAPFKRTVGNLNGRKAQLCAFIRLAAHVNAARGDSRLSAACKARFADRGGCCFASTFPGSPHEKNFWLSSKVFFVQFSKTLYNKQTAEDVEL